MTKKPKIIVDTREGLPYWKNNVIKKKLDTGDYSLEGMETRFTIDRKSLPDLFGTLGKGYTRFRKELVRSQELEYFGIYIEGTPEKVFAKDFPGSYHIKRMTGRAVMRQLKTIEEKYGVHVVFCESRVGCKRAIKKKFSTLLNSEEKLLNIKEGGE